MITSSQSRPQIKIIRKNKTLLEKINFLSEESAIDIRSIELRGRTDKKEAINITLQVNGIIGINEECFEEESEILIKKIERCLI